MTGDRGDGSDVSAPKKPRTGFEENVGITEYVGTHKGFNGVLKQRYSDFLVNEIDPLGRVVRLETLEPPPEPAPDTSWASETVSAEAKEQLEQLAEGKRTEPVLLPAAGLSKEQRGQLHAWVRAHWPHLESHTGDGTVRVGLSTAQRRRALPWPAGRPSYTTFVLYKENMDTIEAVNRIATMLRMRPSCLGYAGTKDKRGKTCQRLSCHRLPAKRLLELNCRSNLRVGNITFEDAAIKLGDLQGNRFSIVLREVDGTTEDHREAVRSLSENGFLNYYGTQRFGTTSVATHQIGRALLQGRYEEAVDLILQPRDGGALAACREEWARSKDAGRALSKLPHRGCIEGLLLQALTRGGATNYLGALLALPRNVRLLYLHGYQSYVWNRLVSRRVQRFGLAVLPGDLLLAPVPGGTEEEPRAATAEDVGSASLQQVVLPLPGHSVRYPENEMADWYREILTEDGLSMDAFSEHRHRELSMSGCYRHLVAVPREVTWKEVSYTDPQASLLLSDLDRLQGVPEPVSCQGDSDAKRALILEFSLSSCCYATMAIRELMHRDCSSWAPAGASG